MFSRGQWRAAAMILVAAATTYNGAAAEPWRPSCDETRTGQYTFEGLGGSTERPVRIYLCPDVHCASKTDFATVTRDAYSAPRPLGLARPYFLVEGQRESQTERCIIGARRLALEGAYNFRDLGGIETADGRTIRWGEVFRSDTLARLTSADYSRLNTIGISLVCDLRRREERKLDPTEWQSGSPVFVLAPVNETDNGASLDGDFADALRSGKVSAEEGRTNFAQHYIHMVLGSAPKFGAVLRAIETSDRPSMFHCTGGRDRTGITAALLLHILGVSNETIVSDYLLSTRYLKEQPIRTTPPSTAAEVRQARLFDEVTRLQPRYIETIFKAIDERYGSFDRYRREALHFSDADVVALKARLLE
jgi:protein-tyrosine phosphatase